MTRKRFIKLCMARGYSRNEANELARESIEVYGAYSVLFMITLLGSYEFCEAFSEAIRTAASIVEEACDRFMDEVRQIKKLLQE